MKYLMCNLKSNKNLKEILEYKKQLVNIKKEGWELVLFPSSLYLSFFYDVPYSIGSQNFSTYLSGSFTGEILGSQLKSLKVSYVLVNHIDFLEDAKTSIIKIQNATENGLKVVLCIGEKEKQTMEETVDEIKKSINAILNNLTEKEIKNCILAYEPAWSVRTKEINNIEVLATIIKKLKEKIFNQYSFSLPILYGGGITLENITEIAKFDIIDGYLLGNCANNPKNICQILNKF